MSENPHRTNIIGSVDCAIITVSDTRTRKTDQSGLWMRQRLESAGHKLISYEILPDEPGRVRERVVELSREEACQAVLLTGGTGITSRDTTQRSPTSRSGRRCG